MSSLAVADKIRLRASVNEWISKSFPTHRKYLKHSTPEFIKGKNLWQVIINAEGHSSVKIGIVWMSDDATIIETEHPDDIVNKLSLLFSEEQETKRFPPQLTGEHHQFNCGDGISASTRFEDREIDLLLTDPPYGISKSYICEKQVPRRLRNDGRDFIMPKGNFGEWDIVDPEYWLTKMLPKVGGWVVSFCSQAQIGEYQAILHKHKFIAIGAMVWQKTNPVPFNHRYKPINAWEAIVVGKRPGTKFNGRVIHNVFRYKSPSPQNRIHPTQKPLELLEHFVELFTNPGDLVYDPFGGAATTLIAAARNERTAISYEMDPEIYQSACGRIAEYLL